MKLGALGLLGVLGVVAGCASSSPDKPTALERRQAIRDASDKTYRSTEGFQTARWGMSPDEVRAALPEASVSPDGTLRMKTTIAEIPAEVSLGFLDNRLAAVDVFFTEVSDARTFHSLMRDLLTRKYGDPKTAREVARQVKWGDVPVRFAADLAPLQEAEAAASSATLENALAGQGQFKVLNRWTTFESHVNLTQWTLPSRGIMAIQYESAKYAPKRADLIGRYSTKARQDLVKDL
ncbi:hypothetical protein [Corallococcus exercitus]|uniref:hypothetical protein n=1 Tax=Corallococcus exercitus TaxID=2316736 RepID=UPI0035D4A7DB